MKLKDITGLYSQDPLLQALFSSLEKPGHAVLHLKGLKGSQDAVLIAAAFQRRQNHFLIIADDREQALYLQNDIQHLLDGKEVFFFPASYKKPYHLEETDNANVLQRAEVLNRLNQKDPDGDIVVTYPEALTEKVLNKRTLVENTLTAKVGEKLDLNFMTELLSEYDFERTDFVYEPGQYSVRGGIVDVFSFANELPYRIELFDDEIESIRTFDPNTQLSVENRKTISIIPNVQNKMVQETTEPFLDFFPDDSILWVRDLSYTKEVLQSYFAKATEVFDGLMKESGGTRVSSKPEDRFETSKSFQSHFRRLKMVEFGRKFVLTGANTYEFVSQSQPTIRKDFKVFTDVLNEWQSKGFVNLVVTESPSQFDKIESILEETDPFARIQHLAIGLREGFIDEQRKICLFTDHQLFDRFYRFKSREKHSKTRSLTLKELKTLQPGDYVTHTDYGIARFVGMEKVEINGRWQETIRLLFRDDDLMKITIHALHKISKYSGKEGGPPQMSKLGSGDWDNKKKSVKKKLRELAIDLIGLYAKRKAAPGFAFSKDTYLQAELETSFIYEDTPDQARATEEVKRDMEKPHPMDRLVCGDVGFGKTEVAIRAAFKAATEGKQVAVLVPTTILAMQHYKTFRDRLAKFPVRVEYVSRFRTAAQIKETLLRVKEGKTEILIGTHRIIGKDVQFKNLGLLIIDEEQKFGVGVKEKLKELKVNVDSLTLTATPIPRTLHFSLMGARDLSIISTPPPNRQPVTTEVHVFSEGILRDAIDAEIRRGGQAFLVHNRVSDIESVADQVKRLVPDARVSCAHGQMEGEQLEKAMMKFIDGECDVLVSTNIIESGLDIPNANTIIINQAHHFGLADLHQMRGRVGRSNKKAYCYLLAPPPASLSSEARKRLATLEEFSELGDGFRVAMRDLDIRGAGNLLGAEQSGFISDIGFEMYHKLLDEAVQELKETEFRSLFESELKLRADIAPDCVIETDLSVLIPENYVSNISERLSLYTELDNMENEENLQKFADGIKDRFGPLPREVEDIVETVKLRWIAEKLGFEKVTIKGGLMKCQFSAGNNSEYFKSPVFGSILGYVQTHPKSCTLKEVKDKLFLHIDRVNSIQGAIEALTSLK